MNACSITLRPARPDAGDGLLFARYVNEASDGAFFALLGRRAAAILAAAFVEPNHDYSFEHAVFALDGGAVVGMAAGFRAVPGRRFFDQPLLRAASSRGWILRLSAASRSPLFRIHSTLNEDDFYLQFLAVDEDHRARGIGSALVSSVEERARTGSSVRLAVDVWGRNERAKRFYERHGLTVESRWPKHFFIAGHGVLRMTKRL